MEDFWADDEGFQYVVERKEQDPCFFGSKIPRCTELIGKGLSPFQKRETPEINENVGPGHYGAEKYNTALDRVMNKVRSKRGVGPLASADKRFKDKIMFRTPSPTRYNVSKGWGTQRAFVPFGSKTSRIFDYDNKLPGPGTYPNGRHNKCRRTRFMYNLGRPKMISTVEMFCTSKPTDVCVKCEKLCEGDYWHVEHVTFLCQRCWMEERTGKEMFSEKQLKQFKKIRNCSFAHRHEGTTAAVRLLPPNKITKKLRLENYLDLYIKC